MAVAVKQSDKHWAFCRYHLGLTDSETKLLTPARFKALKKLWEDDRCEQIKFSEKLVARVLLMMYYTNVPSDKRRHDNVEDFMYFGNKRKQDIIDLSTRDGQKMLSDAMKMLAKK